jgi:transcriptional regulator with XRE-family HTH domain
VARSIDPESREVGVRLRSLRALSDRTVEEIAAELGITPAAWYHWETGRSRIYIAQVRTIAAALHMPAKFVHERLFEERPREAAPEVSESRYGRAREDSQGRPWYLPKVGLAALAH